MYKYKTNHKEESLRGNKQMRNIEDILEHEYSTKFDKLRKNRVLQSYFKYGPAKINFGEGHVNAVGSLKKCLAKFEKTGNTEYLCDVANYAMFGYMFPQDGQYFKATDSSESAGTDGKPVGGDMLNA